jgi:hypothetical protein
VVDFPRAPVDDPSMTDAPVPSPPASPSPSAGPVGKLREPVAVILLSIVTLGIYALYWQYASFQEMKDHSGEGVGGVVGLILALCIGIVNWFLLPAEVSNLYTRAGRTPPVSWVWGFWLLLPIIGGIIWVVKVQGSLNRYWESLGATR